MKYEDASWHSGADDFPKDLTAQAAGTHSGMFLAWALLGGLRQADEEKQDHGHQIGAASAFIEALMSAVGSAPGASGVFSHSPSCQEFWTTMRRRS